MLLLLSIQFMTTYLTDIIPRIQRFSKTLDDLTILTNQPWVCVDHVADTKTIYVFRSNNELLISTSGEVDKATWQYLQNNSLLIDRNAESLLFRHVFVDETILALKMDNNNKYAVFVNENKSSDNLNSIENVVQFLERKYKNATTNNVLRTVKKNEIKLGDYKFDTSAKTVILLLTIAIILILIFVGLKGAMLGG